MNLEREHPQRMTADKNEIKVERYLSLGFLRERRTPAHAVSSPKRTPRARLKTKVNRDLCRYQRKCRHATLVIQWDEYYEYGKRGGIR